MTPPPNLRARRRLAVLFTVPFVFSLVFFFLALFADRTDEELQKAQDLNLCLARLRSLSSDIEIGEHGFVLTRDRGYLVPLEDASRDWPAQIRACETVAADQFRRPLVDLSKVAVLLKAQAHQASMVVQTLHRSGADAALDTINDQRGEADTANQVRRGLEELESKMTRHQSGVLQYRHKWNRFSYLFFTFGTLAMAVVLVRLYSAAVTYLEGRDTLQHKLEKLNEQLENEVEQRTADLQVANEELQQFAYVASHDLQEPLRTITSFTQLLQGRYQGKLDEDADEFIGYIVSASQRMRDLINGLLALARLRKAGHPTGAIPLNELVEEAKSNLAAAITESGAAVTSDPMPSLVVDRVQILQLLQNLISNAIKYRRPDAPPSVHISSVREATQWIVSVRDNGRGFEQQFADRIFGLFQRLPGGNKVDGTGIGLTIARKIAERHGGRIWAESTVGDGSTFRFSLPTSLELSHATDVSVVTPSVLVQRS